MEEIKIKYTDSGFYIEQGDKQTEMLGWDKMLGTIAALTMPNPCKCLGWMKPKMQFKDGDFVVSESESCKWIAIIKGDDNDADYYHSYFGMYTKKQPEEIPDYWFDEPCDAQTKNRPATEEEKRTLLFKLHEIGKNWNAERKCVEDIWTPKAGDFVTYVYSDGDTFVMIYEKNDWYYASLRIKGCHLDGIPSYYLQFNNKYTERRPSTCSEKQLLLDLLHKEGKDWDAEKKEIVEYKWRPKEGEIFYYVNSCMITNYSYWKNNYSDIPYYELGNCFKTEEEAQEMADKLKEVLKKSK